METLLYFAYGSNLFSPRLRFRVKSCEFVSPATLPARRLVFHKRSTDGSSKCDAFEDPNHNVLGVIYRIAKDELPALRLAEGVGGGYEEKQVKVMLDGGDAIDAITYLASPTHIDQELAPYNWYYDFVSMGCLEHELPKFYVAQFVSSVEPIKDPDSERELKKRAEIAGEPLRSLA